MSNVENESSFGDFSTGASNNSSFVSEKDSETGFVRGELKPHEIIAKLQDVYEKLLQKIDEDASEESLQLKVATLQSWVKDLGEQNTILVETVEQLEREAAERVILLEDRIHQTSHAAMKYMNKLQEYDNQLQDFTEQKHRVTTDLIAAQKSQEYLQSHIFSLQNDISSLLELVKRAKMTGSWALDGLVFQEISSSDLFTRNVLELKPLVTGCSKVEKCDAETMTHSLEDHKANNHYKQETAIWKKRATESEMELVATKSQLTVFEECAVSNEAELASLRKQFQETDCFLKNTIKENEDLYSQLEAYKKQLISKDKEIESVTKSLNDLDKFSKDERAALTAEVAEKHDEIRSLTEKNKLLENRCRDANMQTRLKDDIIKQMRKDIKHLKSLSYSDTSTNYNIDGSSITTKPCYNSQADNLLQSKSKSNYENLYPNFERLPPRGETRMFPLKQDCSETFDSKISSNRCYGDCVPGAPRLVSSGPAMSRNSCLPDAVPVRENMSCKVVFEPRKLTSKSKEVKKSESKHASTGYMKNVSNKKDVRNELVDLYIDVLGNDDLCQSCKRLIIENIIRK